MHLAAHLIVRAIEKNGNEGTLDVNNRAARTYTCSHALLIYLWCWWLYVKELRDLRPLLNMSTITLTSYVIYVRIRIFTSGSRVGSLDRIRLLFSY